MKGYNYMKDKYHISEGSTWLLSIFFILGVLLASNECDKILNLCLNPRKEAEFFLILILAIITTCIGGMISWISFLCYQEFLFRHGLKLHDCIKNREEEAKILAKNAETYAGFVFINMMLFSVSYRIIHAFDREISLITKAPFKSLIGVLFTFGYAFYIGYIYRGYLPKDK